MARDTPLLPQFLHDSLQYGIEETENGYKLNNIFLPEEVILHIFSFVEPNELLNYSLVCRTWNKLIKSYALWSTLYRLKYHNKPKQLPWYLFYCLLTTNYFNNNLVKNGNGQEEFDHWDIIFGDDCCDVETSPVEADPLPLNVPEFYNHTSCFGTSCHTHFKLQNIDLGRSGLFQYILNTYKPHIYLSEWTAGRVGCGCIYKLRCAYFRHRKLSSGPSAIYEVKPWEGAKWKKIEITITEYPNDIVLLRFEHVGSKMAGGVLKLLFDSIEPLSLDENGKEKAKIFSKIKFETNGQREEALWNFKMIMK